MNHGLPPQDLDAEAAVLSAVMIDHAAIDQLDFLKPEHFYAEAHRQIFAACLALKATGKPVDNVQVGTWLKDRQRLAQVGGMGYLVEVLNAAPAVSNVAAYGRTVLAKARVRALCDWCSKVNAEARGDYGDVQEFLDRTEAELREITQAVGDSTGERIDAVVKRVLTGLGAAGKAGNKTTGILSGFEGLDRRMGGFKPGTLTIVAGRPGMGKSAFALNMAEAMAVAGHWVPFFSLEMSNDEQGLRTISSGASVHMSRLQSVSLMPGDWQALAGYAKASQQRPLFLFDEHALSPQSLAGKVRRLKVEAERAGAKLGPVFVDYLQLMKPATKTNSREQEVSGISRALKVLAKEVGVPLVVMSQLNRDGEKDAKPQRPKLSSLRESGAIEQDADIVLFIHRESYYSKDDRPKGEDVAEIIIAKGRNVEKSTVKVRFDGQFTRFGAEEIGE
jgi:replicative DNA helicase